MRLFRSEQGIFCGVGDHHDSVDCERSFGDSLEEQLSSVTRPERGSAAAARRYLPLAARRICRKRPDIYIRLDSFARSISQPMAVRRERRGPLQFWCSKEKFRLTGLGMFRVAPVDRKDPNIAAAFATFVLVSKVLGIRRKRVRKPVRLRLD